MRRKLCANFLIALVGMLASASAASSAPPQSATASAIVAACHDIKEAASRLACFDSLSAKSSLPDGSRLTPQGDRVIAKWSSSGQMNTRPFHIDGPWELQWSTDGGYFSATLHRTSGSGAEQAVLANGMERGSSSSYQPTGGDFYLEFVGLQPWSARVVSVPSAQGVGKSVAAEEPLLSVEGDQSALPACDDAAGAETIKNLVEGSPLGQTMHLSIVHVSKITPQKIKDGMTICRALMLTNGGEAAYDFQYYRQDGQVYVYGKPVDIDS